ncbi:unnamed protein product [Caenorhabditis bovis]|uniref:LisH domain-containing protein n=1 Tax=Caenorhabditis bovis TaxID=2654633 RepID=A0A8S1F2F1_9PELO|nr:unnamed protein product [Caenorhabditis bovis]
MFQQQTQMPRGNGQPHQSLTEIAAKEKFNSLIFEYLSLSGATKTAEAFKEEVLSSSPNLANIKAPEKGQPFLYDWFSVFWDLYCAAPERRDSGEPYTQEAKYFQDYMTPDLQQTLMAPSAFGPGRFAPNRMPPAGMPPAGFGMFPGDPRMARMPGNSLRMPPGAPFPGAPPPGGMRPGPPGMQDMGMPRYQGFMDQPFPGASSSGMMPNGGIPPMPMSSPGMPPPVSDGSVPFMGMAMPPSSSAMPFSMNEQTLTPTSAPPAATTPVAAVSSGNISNPPTMPPCSSDETPSSNAATAGMPASVGAPTSLMNGDDIKSSPVSTPHGAGVTGGTPAPGSAQSAALAQPATPSGGPPSHPPLSAGAASQGATEINASMDDNTEISKIKEGLLDGFMKTEAGTEAQFFT